MHTSSEKHHIENGSREERKSEKSDADKGRVGLAHGSTGRKEYEPRNGEEEASQSMSIKLFPCCHSCAR